MASSKDCPYLSERRAFSPGGVVSSCFPPLPPPFPQHFSPAVHSYHLDHTWASCATHRKYRGPWKEISEEIKTKIQKRVFQQASEALKMKKCWTYPKFGELDGLALSHQIKGQDVLWVWPSTILWKFVSGWMISSLFCFLLFNKLLRSGLWKKDRIDVLFVSTSTGIKSHHAKPLFSISSVFGFQLPPLFFCFPPFSKEEISEEIKTKIQKRVFQQASEALKMKKCWTYPKFGELDGLALSHQIKGQDVLWVWPSTILWKFVSGWMISSLFCFLLFNKLLRSGLWKKDRIDVLFIYIYISGIITTSKGRYSVLSTAQVSFRLESGY